MIFFHVKWNFHGMGEKLLLTTAVPIASLNLYIIHWYLSEKTDIGTKPHVPNRILCKAADLSRQPVRGKGVYSDSNRTAQRLQMAARKMILNRLQPKFAAKSVASKMWPVQGKGVYSDSNQTAQRLPIVARKSLETMSDVILNRLQPKFAVKSVANEMRCLKAI